MLELYWFGNACGELLDADDELCRFYRQLHDRSRGACTCRPVLTACADDKQSPSGAATSGSPDDVGTPTSALSPAAGSTSGVTATAAGAEEAVVTKTSNASPFAKLPSSVNHCTAFIATVIGALLL